MGLPADWLLYMAAVFLTVFGQGVSAMTLVMLVLWGSLPNVEYAIFGWLMFNLVAMIYKTGQVSKENT